MKGKRVGIVLAVLLLLGSVVSLSFMSNIPREKPDKEEINDRTIDQQSDEAPSALLKITQTLEPVLLGKTGQAAGEVAYSFSVKPLTSGIKHISFLSGNPDVKFVEYVLLPEDDSDNVEEGFAENRVLRQSTSQQLSPDGTIPCNATKWLETPVEREVAGGEEVEIIIVDDGSAKDRTGEIADRYAREYPTICRAIHQENGGHGEAVNTGLKNATGIFFKVVDSDDWVDEAAYQEILATLRRFVYGGETLDMLVTNFVYEKEGARRKKVMKYHTAFPKDKVFGWNDVKFFMTGQYILMHSVIYRTGLLIQCGLELPKHTFYVDNIFVYQPLPHVKHIYYLDVNFYRYYIGRQDQSVNEEVMIGRIDQQIRVTKLMLGYYDAMKISSRKLRHYMIQYLEIMMTICSVLAIKSGTEENLEKKKELWQYLKKQNLPLYLRLRMGFLGQGCNLPGKGGRELLILGYKITQKFYGFN